MRYYATPSSPRIRRAMTIGLLGCVCSPRSGDGVPDGARWFADNGCYSDAFDQTRWWRWLNEQPRTADFVVAPDVVADHQASIARSAPWLPKIRALGFSVALVAQNGMTVPPWGDFDVLFIGGDTEWKLGHDAQMLTEAAVTRGVPVHMGRVNSYKRLRIARDFGVTSADGTWLTYAPEPALWNLLRALRRLDATM